MNDLSDAQIAAIAKFERLKVGALFMEMGTGKTRVALNLMASRKDVCDFFVWICPCTLRGELEAERQKWQPDLKIKVVGIESIGQSKRIFEELKMEVKMHSKVFLVLDESLKIKNRDANRTQRLCELAPLTEYRLILNGTPVSKNILDLYTQIFFLSPKILNMSFNQFMRTYCDLVIEAGRSPRVDRERNLDHLANKISPYVFEEKLFLDIKKEVSRSTYYISEVEYNSVKNSILDEFESAEHDLIDIDFYTLITKLQRWYTSQEQHYNAIYSEIESIGNEQVIIFVKYLETIPHDAISITGKTSISSRNDIISRFKAKEFNVLWLTYGIGAYGLNLQCAHHIIFAEHSWDYAQRIQAEARVYRMGQTETVYIHDIVCANAGLESLILRNIARKERTANVISHSIAKLKEIL